MKARMSMITARVIAGAFCAGMIASPAFADDIAVSGDFVVGVDQVTLDEKKSAKFNEYRDIQSGPVFHDVEVKGEKDSGYYFEIMGKNLGRKDQQLNVESGRYGGGGFKI